MEYIKKKSKIFKIKQKLKEERKSIGEGRRIKIIGI